MLSKVRRTFKKGYLLGWTEETFVVDRILDTSVPSYKIKEYDGTPVKGTFYEEELQKVDMNEDTFFRIEKVLKKNEGKVLVSWKGWPSEYDSWVDEKDVVDFTKKKNAKKLKKMATMFYLTLPRNANSITYPENNPGKFKVKLPKEIRLPENDWEVALANITFPSTLDTVIRNDVNYQLLLGTDFMCGLELDMKDMERSSRDPVGAKSYFLQDPR